MNLSVDRVARLAYNSFFDDEGLRWTDVEDEGEEQDLWLSVGEAVFSVLAGYDPEYPDSATSVEQLAEIAHKAFSEKTDAIWWSDLSEKEQDRWLSVAEACSDLIDWDFVPYRNDECPHNSLFDSQDEDDDA